GPLMKRGSQEILERIAQAHVVNREVECLLRRADKIRQASHHRCGELFILGEKENRKIVGHWTGFTGLTGFGEAGRMSPLFNPVKSCKSCLPFRISVFASPSAHYIGRV